MSTSSSVFSPAYRLITGGVLIVVTMVAFEGMAISTAMPTAARELDGLAHYAWIFSGFVIANIVGIVSAGVLAGQRGPKPALVLGLTTFFAGLLIAGSAQTMTELIAGRLVQGYGAGTLITTLYVVIGESYPETLRPKVFAHMSGAWVLPGLIGPPVSGLITQHAGWRWVFFSLAPIVVLGAAMMAPQLRSMQAVRRTDVPADGRRRFVRALALACGIGVLLQAGQSPSLAWIVPALLALAAVAWGLPGLVPPGTFGLRPGVPAAVALRGLMAGALFGFDVIVPLVMTVQHGLGPALAGAPLVATAVTWTLGSWWQGRDAMNGRRPALVRAGFACLTVALAGGAVASVPSVPTWVMFVTWALAGVGAGLTMSSVGVLMLAQTTDADRARDSAALQLSDGVLTALSTGFGGVLVAAAVHDHISYTTAFVGLALSLMAISIVGGLAAPRTQARGPQSAG